MAITIIMTTEAAAVWRLLLLPVMLAIAVASGVDMLLLSLLPLVAPGASVHFGSAAAWVSLAPTVLLGAVLRVALPAIALCGILYLLRTNTPPVRHDVLIGLALSLGWVAVTLAIKPPQEAAVTLITLSPGGSVPSFGPAPGPKTWPPFGPPYFGAIDTFAALASVAMSSRRRTGLGT